MVASVGFGKPDNINEVAAMLTRDGFASLARHCNRETALYHARAKLPYHFTEQGYALYGFRRRNAKYTERKVRIYGHRNPNVFSGALRDIVLATAPGSVTATRNVGRIHAKGTSAHKIWSRNKEEIEAVNPQELREHGQRWREMFMSLAGTGEFRFRTRAKR